MKKVLSLLLAMTMVLVLAACGGSGNNGGTQQSDSQTNQGTQDNPTSQDNQDAGDDVNINDLIVDSGKLHMSTNEVADAGGVPGVRMVLLVLTALIVRCSLIGLAAGLLRSAVIARAAASGQNQNHRHS